LIDGLIARTIAALAAGWPQVQVTDFTELTGGASSLTYAAALTGGPAQRVVVKVAPPGLAPVRNRDVLRQATVLDRLTAHPDIRVPRVYGRDNGDPPATPPLFVMSFEPGDSAEPLQSPAALDPAVVRARALAAARMLAALHRVGIDDLADEAATPRQELDKWTRALATVPAEILTGAPDVSALLSRQVPEPDQPALSHGDWRLGNTLCVDGEVRSVIDWEIWSVGDPRVDLAWFLMMCDAQHPCAIAGAETGMPSGSDLLVEYEQALGRTVSGLAWFRSLVAYKQAAATALIAKHAAQRATPMEPVVARMSGMLPQLLDWSAALLCAPSAGPPSPDPRSIR
jgi:aminoglycoside phosphotransferase (APT) family kinase protein